jgi:hypothetical protein
LLVHSPAYSQSRLATTARQSPLRGIHGTGLLRPNGLAMTASQGRLATPNRQFITHYSLLIAHCSLAMLQLCSKNLRYYIIVDKLFCPCGQNIFEKILGKIAYNYGTLADRSSLR